MRLDDALERWAYWFLHNGFASSYELSRMIDSGQDAIGAGSSSKPRSIAIVSDDIERLMHRLISEELTESQRIVILYQYKILRHMPTYLMHKQIGGIPRMSKNTIAVNLHRARLKLSILTGFHRLN